jgi:hypothetical protein
MTNRKRNNRNILHQPHRTEVCKYLINAKLSETCFADHYYKNISTHSINPPLYNLRKREMKDKKQGEHHSERQLNNMQLTNCSLYQITPLCYLFSRLVLQLACHLFFQIYSLPATEWNEFDSFFLQNLL